MHLLCPTKYIYAPHTGWSDAIEKKTILTSRDDNYIYLDSEYDLLLTLTITPQHTLPLPLPLPGVILPSPTEVTNLLCVEDTYDTYDVVIKCPVKVPITTTTTNSTTTTATLSQSFVVNSVLAHSGAIDNETEAEHTTNNSTTNNNTTNTNTVPSTATTVPTRSLRAHRSVLSLRSPVFKQMLDSDMVEGTSFIIMIDDVSSDIMSEVLIFIYSNTFSSNDIYNILNQYVEVLLYIGHKYEITGLVSVCEAYIIQTLNIENSIHMYKLAGRYIYGVCILCIVYI